MNFLKKIWPWKKRGAAHPQLTQPQQPVIQISFRSGWIIFLSVLLAGLISLLLGYLSLGIGINGLNLLFLAYCLHEIKQPNIAFLFKMGVFKGSLGPGWYVAIPHLWDIEQIPTEWIQIRIDGDMYTQEKTLIFVDATVRYRVNEEKLQDVLLMMPKNMEQRVHTLALSYLRGAVGGYPFSDLVEDKGKLENAVVNEDQKGKILGLKNEIEKHGYEFGDFKIDDFDEKIQSEAEKIRILGKARGEAAEALATPLKDNLPAALANIATTFTESLSGIFGKPKKHKQGEASGDSDQPKDQTLSAIADSLKKLSGRL